MNPDPDPRTRVCDQKFEESQYIHSSLDSVKYDTSKLHDPDPLTQLKRIHIFQYVVTGNWSSISGIRLPPQLNKYVVHTVPYVSV